MEESSTSDTLPLAESPSTLHEQIADFFRIYDPVKLQNIVDIVAKYGSDEMQLKEYLEARYDVPGFFASQHLHFASRYFDSVRALYDGHLVPPYLDAAPLDNVHKAQILLPKAGEGVRESSMVQVGILHADKQSAADAAWWRGDVTGTALTWLVEAIPQDSPMAWLKPRVKAKAVVRVMTQQGDAAGNTVLCCWHGWLKGADSEGNVLLIGATRAVHRVWDGEGKRVQVGGEAASIEPPPATSAAVLLHAPFILSISNGTAAPGAPPVSQPSHTGSRPTHPHSTSTTTSTTSTTSWAGSKEVQAMLRR